MDLKIKILIFIFVLGLNDTYGQKGSQAVTIIADLTNFTGNLPKTNRFEWSTNDTIIPLVTRDSKDTLGAEFLELWHPGDVSDPNFDSSTIYFIKKYKAQFNGPQYMWQFKAIKPTKIINKFLLGDAVYQVQSGDSIYITYVGSIPTFSGRGSVKYQALYEIYDIITKEKRKEPIPFINYELHTSRYINTEEYTKLSLFYDSILKKVIHKLNAYKNILNPKEFDLIKAQSICTIESYRLLAFTAIPLEQEIRARKEFKYSNEDLGITWDRTMNQPLSEWLRSPYAQNLSQNISYIGDYVCMEQKRRFGFNIISDSAKNEPIFMKLVYEQHKTKYIGLFRDRLLCHFIQEQIIEEMGSLNWFAQSILKDYYNLEGFASYKNWMRSWERKHMYVGAGTHSQAPLFSLKDTNGNIVSNNQINGKFTVLNFWYKGCEPCKELANKLTILQKELADDTTILFLNISTDSDQNIWLKEINEGVYAPKKGLHLSIESKDHNNEILKDMNISEFPTLRFIDGFGSMVIVPTQSVTETIKEKASLNKDGPYLFKVNNEYRAYSFKGNSIIENNLTTPLKASTDIFNASFTISIKKETRPQSSIYAAPEKILVISDIEGNFKALRQLLQINKVIDENLNWIFGPGHLVIAGDLFDRGNQVTECLWLIYSLEEKAIESGGYVHYILGNHEIMNLNGNDKYVQKKYKLNYTLLNKNVSEVYNAQSELGKWLRSKNIIEKIGNDLFTHGGISPRVNDLNLTLDEINTLARPYYDKELIAQKKSDSTLNILFNSRHSPFWYRQYYIADYHSTSKNEIIYHATNSQIDSTCKKFNVKHIITGHTIVSDTISTHFQGKVINTDTKHSHNKSEALLIENQSYYRVTAEGEKNLLFKDSTLQLQLNATKPGRITEK